LTDEKVDEMCRKLRKAFSVESPDDLVDAMVYRFLGWKLPANFYPDCFITFDREKARHDSHNWPVGTNLFTAEQARAMIRHLLGLT
jgi:hypothetical protein